MYAPIALVIVGGSLASLAALAGAFGFCATAPARPRFERAPSPLLCLPGSVVSGFGGILVWAKGEVSAHPYTD
jgi:hypothetical protein